MFAAPKESHGRETKTCKRPFRLATKTLLALQLFTHQTRSMSCRYGCLFDNCSQPADWFSSKSQAMLSLVKGFRPLTYQKIRRDSGSKALRSGTTALWQPFLYDKLVCRSRKCDETEEEVWGYKRWRNGQLKLLRAGQQENGSHHSWTH